MMRAWIALSFVVDGITQMIRPVVRPLQSPPAVVEQSHPPPLPERDGKWNPWKLITDHRLQEPVYGLLLGSQP